MEMEMDQLITFDVSNIIAILVHNAAHNMTNSTNKTSSGVNLTNCTVVQCNFI